MHRGESSVDTEPRDLPTVIRAEPAHEELVVIQKSRPSFVGWLTWDALILLAAVAVFVAVGIALIAKHAPLGHDEAVYALRGRHFHDGYFTYGYWADYRAVGVPFIFSVLHGFRLSDGETRVVMLVLGAAGIVGAYALARHWFGDVAAATTAVALAVTPWYLMGATGIFVDTTVAVFGVGAIMVFAFAASGERVRWWAVAAVPLATAATFCRYGAPIFVAPGLAIVAILRWSAVRRSVIVVSATAIGTALGTAAVLFVPAVTGSTLAPYRAFNERAKRLGDTAVPFTTGVRQYVDALPDVFATWLCVVLAVGAALLVVQIVLRVRRHEPFGRHVAVIVAVLASFALLSRTVIGGWPQYLLPLLPFTAMVIGAGFAPVLQKIPRATLVPLLVVALGAGAAFSYGRAETLWNGSHADFDVLRLAAFELRADAPSPCVVVTSYAPQIGWYTDCNVTSYAQWQDASRLEAGIRGRVSLMRALPDDAPVYWFLVNRGKRQPGRDGERVLARLSTGQVHELGDPAAGPRQFARWAQMGVVGDYR